MVSMTRLKALLPLHAHAASVHLNGKMGLARQTHQTTPPETAPLTPAASATKMSLRTYGQRVRRAGKPGAETASFQTTVRLYYASTARFGNQYRGTSSHLAPGSAIIHRRRMHDLFREMPPVPNNVNNSAPVGDLEMHQKWKTSFGLGNIKTLLRRTPGHVVIADILAATSVTATTVPMAAVHLANTQIQEEVGTLATSLLRNQCGHEAYEDCPAPTDRRTQVLASAGAGQHLRNTVTDITAATMITYNSSSTAKPRLRLITPDPEPTMITGKKERGSRKYVLSVRRSLYERHLHSLRIFTLSVVRPG